MYLGLNLSHDSSAALLDADGSVLYAIGEERLSRVKNHVGIPFQAIEEIFKKFDVKALNKVVVGSHNQLNLATVNRFFAQEQGNPSNPRGKAFEPFPSFELIKGSPKVELIKFLLSNSILGKNPDLKVIFLNHHDAHIGCGIPLLGKETGLIVSLDGEGDGESGAIVLKRLDGRLQELVRISSLDSLGLLYASVTKKYNFKPLQHEGKITGLAAYGQHAKLAEDLLRFITVNKGNIQLRYSKNRVLRLLGRTSHSFGIHPTRALSIDHIIEMIDDSNSNYADLAFAVQFALERSVEQIVKYWISKTSANNLSLTGGVFANVKLNQRLSEINEVNKVFVFPNMGDGGIAIGGIWSWLNQSGVDISDADPDSMFLGTDEGTRLAKVDIQGLKVENLEFAYVATKIAEDISNSEVVAVLNGPMEFGPRALGNTSILLDPRNVTLVKSVNTRLKRTEFMPFAPSILEENFTDFFSTSNSTLQPFRFMAMTCNVLSHKRNVIPAVTHIDGTARPQIVNRNLSPFFYDVIKAFDQLTGVPVVVNTSFNIHEEPIIRTSDAAISSLRAGAIDVLYLGCSRLTLNK